jgi:hypothetical protein
VLSWDGWPPIACPGFPLSEKRADPWARMAPDASLGRMAPDALERMAPDASLGRIAPDALERMAPDAPSHKAYLGLGDPTHFLFTVGKRLQRDLAKFMFEGTNKVVTPTMFQSVMGSVRVPS